MNFPRLLLCVVALLAGGCGWDGPMSTLVARSDVARDILGVYSIITWASVIIAIVVFGILGFVLVRFHERPGAAMPAQTHGRAWLEIAWTLGPALILLIIAVPTIQVIFRTQSQAKPPDALEITVRGYQWWWEFRYAGVDVITANELHLPAGRPVVFALEGPDVIHSFWIPKLGGKRDVVPGRRNVITVVPERPGEFWGQCAEFCGISHANMGMRVVVHTADDFGRWAAAQRAPAAEPSGDAAAAGKALFTASACVGCHTIRGVSAGVLGPDLTHFGSRRTLAGGMLANTPEHLGEWVRNAPGVKPGVKMPPFAFTDEQVRALTAYLSGLK